MICRNAVQGESVQLDAQETSTSRSEASMTAEYIEELVGQMETLAAGAGLEPLQFLLARAREEAKRAAS